MQGAGDRVQGAGCRVQEGAGCRVQGAGGCRVQGAGCRGQGTLASGDGLPPWRVGTG